MSWETENLVNLSSIFRDKILRVSLAWILIHFNDLHSICIIFPYSQFFIFYLRGCLHETKKRNSSEMKFRFAMKKMLFTSVFGARKWNEIHFCFDLLIHYLCFYEILACTDVSFKIASFRRSVYIIFFTRN